MGEDEQPILNVIGAKVALGPVLRSHVPLIVRWNNDFEVTRTLNAMRPFTIELVEAHYERSAMAKDETHFTIYERATMRPIGGANLTEIDVMTATFAIVIGEKDCWGKGYGTEATQLMLDFGFNSLGLHNIMLTVNGNNERAIRTYLRAGFREMGRRRQAIKRGGQLYDRVYMDCLASEFESPVLRRLILGDREAGA